ncbi:MAG: hypothetical protein NVSMB57_09470 [Actinomycetota bacterium]
MPRAKCDRFWAKAVAPVADRGRDGPKMKAGIHPEYVECQVRCSCGNAFTTRSVRSELHVELCSQCHPFYTGKQKLVDTGGRVEKFQRRFGGKVVSKKAQKAAEAEAGAAEAGSAEASAEPGAAE